MKNRNQEHLLRLQRQFHRNHQWRLQANAIHLTSSYTGFKPDDLSWWDDIGFILNGRRYMVWWEHPRQVYEDEIETRAYQEAAPLPPSDRFAEGGQKNYKRLGASRKKLIFYSFPEPSAESDTHYERLCAIESRLKMDGIDCTVFPSMQRTRHPWGTGVSLVAPVEIRSEADAAELVNLAQRLILGTASLKTNYQGYRYQKENWLAEKSLRRP